MTIDEQILDGMTAYVAQVEPSPAGWDAIRDPSRHRRQGWRRSVLAVGGVLAIVAVAVVVRLDASREDPTTRPTQFVPSGARIAALWPLHSEGEVEAWKRDPGEYAFLADADETARKFVELWIGSGYRLQPVHSTCPGYCGDKFWVLRGDDRVTTVHVSQPGGNLVDNPKPGTPHVVTAAWDRDLALHKNGVDLDQPAPGAQRSPLTVRGMRPADGELRVTLQRATDDAVETLAEDSAGTGGMLFQSSLRFFESGEAVLRAEIRGPSGDLEAVTMHPVQLSDETAEPTTTPGPPALFTAVQRDRLGKYQTSGTLDGWVDAHDERRILDAQIIPGSAGSRVVYARSTEPCVSGIWTSRTSIDLPVELVPAQGFAHTRPTVGPSGLVYLRTSCTDADAPTQLVWEPGDDQATRVVAPDVGTVLGPITWSGRFLVFVSERDGVRRLHSVDSTGELGDSSGVAPEPGCRWQAATVRILADANTTIAAQSCPRDGATRTRITELDADHRNAKVLFEVAGDVPWLDVDDSGRHLIYASGSAVHRIGLDGKDHAEIALQLKGPDWAVDAPSW